MVEQGSLEDAVSMHTLRAMSIVAVRPAVRVLGEMTTSVLLPTVGAATTVLLRGPRRRAVPLPSTSACKLLGTRN